MTGYPLEFKSSLRALSVLTAIDSVPISTTGSVEEHVASEQLTKLAVLPTLDTNTILGMSPALTTTFGLILVLAST